MNQDPQILEVIPKRGIGPAFFGMSVREVEDVLGRAPEAYLDDDGTERYIVLTYPGAALFFDQSEDFRFASVEVDRECRCDLLGEPLFPRFLDQTRTLLHSHYSEEEMGPILEKRNEDVEELSLNLPSLRMTFYFNLSDELQQMQWSVAFGPDDEIEWPQSIAPA